jgi:2'-5' RNA ligase
LWDALDPVRRRRPELPLKWVRVDNIHLSLKFLGDVRDEQLPALHAALQDVARGNGRGGEPRPLTLHLGGFGVFPDYRHPHVLWAGVAPEPALELLQHRIERAFEPLGFPGEARAFRPHVTLARATRQAQPRAFRGLEALLAGIAFETAVTIEYVDLMHSTLRPDGPVYQVQDRERLS